ncbi:hypothetical protein BJ166DRAFT_329438 [Pestalotiopsis sp. NC0098]|nr:hypothetical protein BJ166DRAFT_329438 [Pestalotiopsis sp. NC0098]
MPTLSEMVGVLSRLLTGRSGDTEGEALDEWARLAREKGVHDWRCWQHWKTGMDSTHIAAQAYSNKLEHRKTPRSGHMGKDEQVFVNPDWHLPRDGRRGEANPRRLLCRQGLVQDADTLEPAPYAVVSYVWTEFPEVNLDEIRTEMESRTGISHLWADRICINQNDPKDKAREVVKMSSYYLGASACLIFTKQQGLMEAVEEWKAAGRHPDADEYLAALEQCVNLIKSAYFKRVWTMQELELSAFCYILTPSGWVAGNDIDALLTTAVEITCRAVPAAARHRPDECRRAVWNAGDPEGGFERMVAVFDKRWTRWGATDAEWLKSIRRPLMVVWHRAKGRRCSEQKDYLWGVSALIERWEDLGASYEEPMEVTMRKVLSKDTSATAILRYRETLSFPCWMPAFLDGVPDLGTGWQLDEEHAELVSFSEERIVMDAMQVWPGQERSEGILRIVDAKGEVLHDLYVGAARHSPRRHDWKRLWVVSQRMKPESVTDAQYLLLFDTNEQGEIVQKVDTIHFSPQWRQHGISKVAGISTKIHIG